MTDEHQRRQDELRERHLGHLRAFVLRARRVREHAFVRDKAAMALHREPRWLMEGGPKADGKVTMVTHLPSEELIESLAARVRPYQLTEDPTYYPNFMNALTFFAREASAVDGVLMALREKKKDWGEMHSRSTVHSHYALTMQIGNEPPRRVTDTELGFSWLNGDVVHAKADSRELGQQFGIVERFRAAVPIIIRLADLSNSTLAFIEAVRGDGALPELDDAFGEEVHVAELTLRQEAQVWSGDADMVTEPTLDGKLGVEWEPYEGDGGVMTAKRDRNRKPPSTGSDPKTD